SCDVFIANNIDYDLFASKSGYKEYNITIPKEIVEQAKTQLQYRDKQLLFMVSVFKDDEYRKDRTAIPVYNYVLENDLSDFSIKLLADKYYYVVKDRFGKVVFEGDIQ
ncbi:MAG: hypothetical protein LBU83_02045, partial [Bacteroidales bacterium]|nr:hypothetical protein [Bacteroidales bacterium]